jgi:hypothetical protein
MSREDAEKRAKALDWVSFTMKDHPQKSKVKAVEEAALRFNLSPLEEEWLLRQLTDGKLAPDDSSS